MNYAFETYRLTNRIGSLFVPNWAAKNASQKFLRPNRYAIKAWEQEAEQAGTRFTLTDGVSAIRWSQKDSLRVKESKHKQILLVHGWESRATQMYGLVKELVAQGYTVVAVDMPGHGHSSGETSNAYLFSQTVKLAFESLGYFETIIGHSMGAGATAIAIGHGVTTDRVVLISGPASVESVLRRFSKFVGLNKNTTQKFIESIGRYVGVSATELDATKLLKSCDIPALIIHDELDIEVPVGESTRLAQVFKRSELFVTKGLGHRKILKSEDVLKKIHHFVMAEVG